MALKCFGSLFGMAVLVLTVLALSATTTRAECSHQSAPKDCSVAYSRGCTVSGVYTIDPGCGKPFPAYCEMKPNEQYIVFQRRTDGSQNFYRGWNDYASGFGDIKGEFWIGLNRLHCLTSAAPRAELRVDVADFEGNHKYAHYSYFHVGSASNGYKLTLKGYHGTAGDMMTPADHSLSGMQFSTFDHDSDLSSSNCAIARHGAWWYRDCTYSNLNGGYFEGQTRSDGIQWNGFADDVSMKYAQMKLRLVE